MKRMRLLRALLGLLLSTPLAAFGAVEDELLEPDKAFALSTRVVDAHTLEASWKIAPGYYMYRDKFRFEVLDGDVALKPAVIPPGKKKDDPFFGSVETYTKTVKVRLPLERRQMDAHTARMKITAQGCNEPIGVCYPPIIKEVSFALPAVKAKAEPPAMPVNLKELKTLKDLNRLIEPSAAEPAVVDPEKAFVITVSALDANTLKARLEIADCCYLYRDKTRFELAGGAQLGSYTLPPGKVKVDEFIGKTEVYYGAIEVKLPLQSLRAASAATLKVHYQGCSEKGVTICYPPATKTFGVDAAGGALRVAAVLPGAPSAPAKAAPRTENSKFILAVLAAFGTGLLLTFTPCVLPMIPILSSVIVGAGDRHITKLEGGMMSSSYVLGTAVTYTVAGVVAGATGEQLQAYFQNPWAIGIFSTLFVLLALSMFGFYELQMPAFIQSHLHRHSSELHHRTKHVRGGAYVGTFVLGLFAALIIGACVSPLFISALGVAIANRDPWLGGAIMLSMALGMGVILVAVGVGAGFLLPKAGPWMEKVKHVFGVLLLAVAIYLLGFLPEVPVLLLWATLFIVAAIYLGATESLPKDAGGWRYLWKGVGTFLLVWGVLALLGGLAGNRDILSPLPLTVSGSGIGMGVTAESKPAEHLFERVGTLSELEGRLAEAKAAGKPAILDYYATWCTDCLRMEKATFANPRVREELQRRFVLLQADVTDPNDPETKAIKSRFGVFGPPAILFFAASGEERRELRAYGFRSVEEFLVLLRQV